METDRTSGTYTFVFTDIEGSTKLLRALGDDYARVLREHDAIIRAATEANGGRAFGSEGDAQHLVFTDAASAIRAAARSQRELTEHEWPAEHPVRVRMGIHSGEARHEGDDFVGMTLHETARIESAGHGGQVLVSPATRELAQASLPNGVTLQDVGDHTLKDVEGSVRLYQLDIDGLQTEFPALRTLGPVKAVLPTQLSSFVRRAEVGALADLIGTSRLVTLTGPGGTGKTRLAIEVADETTRDFPDGTYFVALDALTDPELVMAEVASVLSIPGGPNSPLERVVEHLRDKTMLLVLDNFEQVVEASADIGRLLGDCPGVSIIATSRVPLRLAGEQEFAVPPLLLPPADQVMDAESAAGFESVRLFVERATAVRASFVLDAETTPVVIEIVSRLDGLPLAIELAAARVRMLGVSELRDRLTDSLGVLAGGSRDLPERQRTLRATIQWSHDLLDEADRRLFSRFSVMAGDAAFSQIEAICGPTSSLGQDPFEGLESLTQQSLVRSRFSTDEETRFEMLVTVRDFAREMLEATDEAESMLERHAQSYKALAEEAAPNLQGMEGARWNDRLEREHDNMRAAIDWSIERDRADVALTLVVSLWRFWQSRGHLVEGEDVARTSLALPSVERQPVELQVKALRAAGGISYWREDFAATHDRYQRALALARSGDDEALLADTLHDAGYAAIDTNDIAERYAAGVPLWEESLKLHRALDDHGGVATDLWAMSSAIFFRGDLERAVGLALEALEMYRQAGDSFGLGWAAHNVGIGLVAVGKLDDATPLFSESLEIWVAAGDKVGLAWLFLDIGLMGTLQDHSEPGWRLIGAAARLREVTGALLGVSAITTATFIPRTDPETDDERQWHAEGESMPLDEAITLARGQVTQPWRRVDGDRTSRS